MDEKTKTGKNNNVLIGTKPFLKYVTAVTMTLTNKEFDIAVIKARGKWISKAVDVAEVITKRFMKDQTKVKSIKTDSEEFENKEGKKVRVSTIEIIITKK